ncbi:hypothetical protein LBW89_18370 [Paenibacillus sp. alder61]|uniref:Uncharacterized protein n=1 Tax=Paenibacillus faecis TaxID=862114 RepID=A0A5D0CL36_9BACL|nr:MULTISPECIES: hypothetical protein [Paenibacillus]MCA1294981.1 hypothetical protein [Paenibacillus sp. alder61]TYA10753.1 hypothetical protein FRY98_23515 [Paenibacillus faecis]
MGISTFLLFECGKSIAANDLLWSINNLCIRDHLYFDTEEEKYTINGDLKYCRVYISDFPFTEECSRPLCFSLFDEPYEYQTVSFKWDDTGEEYFKAMESDDFWENEDLLLRFVYGILKVYPRAKVWVEEDWFYTLEDLEKIKKQPYDGNWCYRHPKLSS